MNVYHTGLGIWQDCLLSLLLSNIILEVLGISMRQEKEVKEKWIGKENTTIFVCKQHGQVSGTS